MMNGAALLGCSSVALPRYGLSSKEKSRIIPPRRYRAASGAAAGFPGNPPNRRAGENRTLAINRRRAEEARFASGFETRHGDKFEPRASFRERAD